MAPACTRTPYVGPFSDHQLLLVVVLIVMAPVCILDFRPWINASRQLIGYGFQDGEYMSGDVLYSSILYWNATKILANFYEDAGPAHAKVAEALQARAAAVRQQITAELWRPDLGAFVAATELESDRISVWGNAFAAVYA